MTQPTLRSRAPAERELGQSLCHWHRESHVRHRGYSPTLGRLIERDPIGFEAGDNNWYRFVANGPTGKTDPSGLSPHTQVTILRLLGSGDPNNFKLAIELLAGIGAKSIADLGSRGPKIVDAFLSRIFSMYPATSMQCVKAAEAVRDVFSKVGQNTTVFTITDRCPRVQHFLLANGQAFSNNGKHVAAFCNGRVYDAITSPTGMTIAEYTAKLRSLKIDPVFIGLPPGSK
ncbi:MAG: hypothetical protein DWI23_01520 [Planctomycetota bacterium]|jgi:RHS repeat-associated protein|nr:MAG: hypothetical protein DWI23_01520 [Planctomycetota bacterium]